MQLEKFDDKEQIEKGGEKKNNWKQVKETKHE